jgi:hypothetical protein
MKKSDGWKQCKYECEECPYFCVNLEYKCTKCGLYKEDIIRYCPYYSRNISYYCPCYLRNMKNRISRIILFVIGIVIPTLILTFFILGEHFLQIFPPAHPVNSLQKVLDQLADNIIFAHNPVKLDEQDQYYKYDYNHIHQRNQYDENHVDYNFLGDTQTTCQNNKKFFKQIYKCNIRIYITIRMGIFIDKRFNPDHIEISNVDIRNIVLSISDPTEKKEYIDLDHFNLYQLYFIPGSQKKIDNNLIVNGKLTGVIRYESEGKIKDKYLSPTVQFIIPLARKNY